MTYLSLFQQLLTPLYWLHCHLSFGFDDIQYVEVIFPFYSRWILPQWTDRCYQSTLYSNTHYANINLQSSKQAVVFIVCCLSRLFFMIKSYNQHFLFERPTHICVHMNHAANFTICTCFVPCITLLISNDNFV